MCGYLSISVREIRERLQQLQDQSTAGVIYRSVSSPSCSSGMGGGNFLSPHSLEGWAEFMGVGGGLLPPSGMHSSSSSSSSTSSHHHHYHHHHRMGGMISGGSPHEDNRGVPPPHHGHERGRNSRIAFNDPADESCWAATASSSSSLRRGDGSSFSPSSSSPPPGSHSMQCFSDVSGQEPSLMTSSSHSDEASSCQWNDTPNSGASWNDWYRGGGTDHKKHEEGPPVLSGVRGGDPSPHRSSIPDLSSDMGRRQGGDGGGYTTTADSWPGERRDHPRERDDDNSEITRQHDHCDSSSQGREKETSEGATDKTGGLSVKAGCQNEENRRKDETMMSPQHWRGEGEFTPDSIHHHDAVGHARGPQGGVFVEKDTGEERKGRGGQGMYASGEGENQGMRSSAGPQGDNANETKQHDGMFHEKNTKPGTVSSTHTQKKNFHTGVEGEDTSTLNTSTRDTESTGRAPVSFAEADGSTQMEKKEGTVEKSLSSSGGGSVTPSGSVHSSEPPVSVEGGIPLDQSSHATGVSASSNETALSEDRGAAPSWPSSTSPEKFERNREVGHEAGRSDDIFAVDRRGYESSSRQSQFPGESRSLGEIGDDVISSSSSSSSMSPRAGAGKGEDVLSGASWGTNTSGSASTRTSFLDRGGGVGGLLSPSVMPDQAPTILSSAPASPRSMLEEKREPGRSDAAQESTNLVNSAESHGDMQEGAMVDTGSIGPDGAAGVGAVVGERGDRIRRSSAADQETISSVPRDGGGGGKGRKENSRNTRGGKRQARSEAHSVPEKGITGSPGGPEDTIDTGRKRATPQVSEVEREVDSTSPGQVSPGCIAPRGLTGKEKSSLARPPGSSSPEAREFAGPGDGGSLSSSRAGGATGGKGGGGGGGGRSGKKKSKQHHRKGKAV